MRSIAVIILLLTIGLAQSPSGGGGVAPGGVPVPPELQSVWEQYERLLEEHPDQLLLHYNFGNVVYSAGDFQRALLEYQTALLADNPQTDARVYYNLGNSLYRAGHFDESKLYFRKALELDPTDEDARVNYELALLQEQPLQQEMDDSAATDPEADPESQESSEEGDPQDESGDTPGDDQSQDQAENSPRELQDTGEGDQSEEEQDEQAENDQPRDPSRDDLDREEAEAILNALRANEEQLLKRAYTSRTSITMEKDW